MCIYACKGLCLFMVYKDYYYYYKFTKDPCCILYVSCVPIKFYQVTTIVVIVLHDIVHVCINEGATM